MRSWRFLLSGRWAAFAVAVLLATYASWWLGQWQFSRLEERRDSNAVIARNEGAAPIPVADVLAPGREVAAQDEWRLVSATGHYRASDTVIVRYRTRDGASGVNVVVPFQTDAGPSLLIDRGWLATANSGSGSIDPPAPPGGQVSVQAWVRADAEGSSTRVSEQSTRAISSVAIGDALGLEVYGGFAELKSEDPAPAQSLEPVELPDLGEGPHFFYGLQWWFFGALAVFGFGYLMYDEWRDGGRSRRPSRTPASGAPAEPATSAARAALAAPTRRLTLRDRLDAWTAPPEDDVEPPRSAPSPASSQGPAEPSVDREHHAGQQ